MTFDSTIKVTDIVMIVAVFAGPIAAVQITEFLRRRQDDHRRKVHLFRTLMATRLTNLDAKHVEALNLIEFEFGGADADQRRVVDTFRLYIAFLNDRSLTIDMHWEGRRKELLASFLYEMSKCLGYHYDQAQIQTGAYGPQGWLDIQNQTTESRILWLEVLRGQRTLNCYNSPQPEPTPSTPAKR